MLTITNRASTVTFPTANGETESERLSSLFKDWSQDTMLEKLSQRPSSEPDYMLHSETNWRGMQISHLLLYVFLHSWLPCLQHRCTNYFPSRVSWGLMSLAPCSNSHMWFSLICSIAPRFICENFRSCPSKKEYARAQGFWEAGLKSQRQMQRYFALSWCVWY